MRDPLPAQEIRDILGGRGFLRLYGQDTFLFVSDLPRRVSGDALSAALRALQERGYITQIDSSNLLLIDLQPERWQALLNMFQDAQAASFPQNETLHGVYALARLLSLHPSDFERQPMEFIRAVFKQYAQRDGLMALAPRLHARCASLLRCKKPLPSALAKVLAAWMAEQSGVCFDCQYPNGIQAPISIENENHRLHRTCVSGKLTGKRVAPG